MLLETERLIITELTLDMAKDIHINSLDDDNKAFVPDEVFETIEDARSIIKFLMSQYGKFEGPLLYALITKESNNNIGYVQIVPLGDNKWEIGYHIAKAYTGHGYATEAVRSFVSYMADVIGINEVYGVYLKANQASAKVLTKCGFEVVFDGIGDYQGEKQEIVEAIWKK